MNVLSLFDGLSCGRIALERAGIPVTNYFASEVDKYAIKVSSTNWPDTIHLGDVTKVKINSICLSEVYSYICNYDNNLQSNISEWEVLYWINNNFTLSAKIGTQKPNERQEVSEPSTIQRIEEVWFSNCEMGSVRKFGDYTTSRRNGEENDIRTSQQLQCSKWGYDNDIYRRYKEENIRVAIGETENGNLQTENIGNLKEKISERIGKEAYFRENEKVNVERGCPKKLLEGEGEDRFSRTFKEEKRNGRAEKNIFINETIRQLCEWDEVNGIEQDYWNILQLHKETQVAVVECEGGFYLFKGKINICIGGSPCQGFSFAGKGLNFNDPRSALFFEYVRILNECREKNPKVLFLLENVRMKKEHEDVISRILDIQPIYINSSLVSAQDRKRLYWTNIEVNTAIKDKGVSWADICEDGWFAGSMRGRRVNVLGKRDDYNKDIPIVQYIESRLNNKTNCLTTVGKDNVVSQKKVGRTPLTDVVWRYLTRNEMERLQTIPDNYTICVSRNQAQKMLGNGWTVDVIVHIFNHIA